MIKKLIAGTIGVAALYTIATAVRVLNNRPKNDIPKDFDTDLDDPRQAKILSHKDIRDLVHHEFEDVWPDTRINDLVLLKTAVCPDNVAGIVSDEANQELFKGALFRMSKVAEICKQITTDAIEVAQSDSVMDYVQHSQRLNEIKKKAEDALRMAKIFDEDVKGNFRLNQAVISDYATIVNAANLVLGLIPESDKIPDRIGGI